MVATAEADRTWEETLRLPVKAEIPILDAFPFFLFHIYDIFHS